MLSAQPRDLIAFLDALTPSLGLDFPSQTLRVHLEPLRSLPHDTVEQKLHRLGYAWVAISTTLLELLVPDTPVDPVAIQNTAAMLQRRECDHITSQLRLHRLLDRIMTGNDHGFILRVLRHRLCSAGEGMPDIISVAGRENVARLHAYWAEIWQFKSQVISREKVSSLLKSFAAANENVMLREQVMQESITGFHQRLAHAYPEFSDLNLLLNMAMSQLRLGLRLLSKAKGIESEAVITTTILTCYPSIRNHLDASFNHRYPILSAFNSIYLCLMQLELEVSTGARTRFLLPHLERLYDQALGLWLIDKAREAESEAASQSLYRGSTIQHAAKTDAELEEQEFLALFPSFEDSLAGQTTWNQETGFHKNVSDEHMTRITALHLNLFSSPAAVEQSLKRMDLTRKNLLLETLPPHVHKLPDSLDAAALVYRLRFANDAQADIQTPMDQRTMYNFYKDPNLPEVKNASRVVIALRSQLKKLSDVWPDQMVLQHLMDRCDVILEFTLKSPIAKVLSALEQLLLQTDDWEMYANRDNSLLSYRQSLTELIVRWRRLELNCWNSLLESEAQAFAEGASEWWFRLYNATIRGLFDAMNTDGEDTYLGQLIPLIDDFVSSSPLGQFTFRIRLLKSFEWYISELSATKKGVEQRCLRRIVCIIHSTLQYYGMFQSTLQSYLMEQRTILDKEIKNFIKLASWKDINVQALKQSAQKTHHQLYKIIRKFREVLREPIAHRLKTGTSTISEAQPLPQIPLQLIDVHLLPIPAGLSASVAGPLMDLGTTMKRFETVVRSKIVPFISRRHNNHADDLATAIITTSKELSEVPVPANLSSEKRTKLIKSLLVRKRKAFSDLLKELKATGLSGNVKAEILRRNTNALWLREQSVSETAVAEFDGEKAETYFLKLLACLPELRASLSNHHSDLQTRELQRGQSFLESGFSIAVNLRAR